jgi:hypothetical protein
MREVQANEVRSTGPKFDTWPASLPYVAYVVADGAFLCVTCANGGNGSRAADQDLDRHPAGTDQQWIIVGAQVNAQLERCAHCERTIPHGPARRSAR